MRRDRSRQPRRLGLLDRRLHGEEHAIKGLLRLLVVLRHDLGDSEMVGRRLLHLVLLLLGGGGVLLGVLGGDRLRSFPLGGDQSSEAGAGSNQLGLGLRCYNNM